MKDIVSDFLEYLTRTKNYSAHTVTAYETDIETGNEVIKSTMKQTQYMTWKEIQKYSLQVTDKWSRTYDHISVSVSLRPLTVLDYFGR